MAKFDANSLEIFRLTEAENFWKKVKVGEPNECWPHRNRPNRSGHTATKFRPYGNIYNHRIAWSLTYGLIPEGLSVLHKCNNPRCCNPYHLYIGTPQDNTQDSIKAGTFNRVKFSDEEIARIKLLSSEGYSQRHIAELVGCTQSYVCNVVNNQRRVQP